MLVKYVSLFPEAILMAMLISIALVHIFRQAQTPKTFATISKICMFLSLISCIIFYNIGINGNWYINTTYTTFFKGLMLLGALLTGSLASKWFLSQNYSSHKYYFCIGFMVLSFCVSISAQNLILMAGAMLVSVLGSSYLLMMNREVTEQKISKLCYIQDSIIFMLLMGIGVSVIVWHSKEWSYSGIIAYYKKVPPQTEDIIASCLILSGIMSIIGAAPFHLQAVHTAKYNILPVVVFMEIIPVITGVAILVTLFHTVFVAMNEPLSTMMKLCGCLSVLMGAIGAGSTLNIRKIYQNVGLFNIGIMLILFSYLTVQDIQVGLIYFLIYLFSIFGIFSCFYGLCSHGEYINNLDDLAGINETKPYIAAALLIFSISLLGIPPLVGLLGNLYMTKLLIAHQSIKMLGFIFFMLVVLSHGLLRIFKTIYFEKKKINFDRADKGVYFSLFLNILIIIITMIDPQFLIDDIEDIIHSFL